MLWSAGELLNRFTLRVPATVTRIIPQLVPSRIYFLLVRLDGLERAQSLDTVSCLVPDERCRHWSNVMNVIRRPSPRWRGIAIATRLPNLISYGSPRHGRIGGGTRVLRFMHVHHTVGAIWTHNLSQEIHSRITSIGFQDCKVFIHSVDAQSSANGGIIIQVIGEMSNKGEAWKKFVQTFFLAEQPNGYFVLNDIFRFLKEESVEEGEEPEGDVTAANAPEHVSVPPAPASPAPPPAPAEPEPIPTPTPAPAVEERAPSPAPTPSPQPQVNGHAPETKPEPAPAPREPTPAPAPEPTSTASPAPVSPAAPPPQQLPPQPAAVPPQSAQQQQQQGTQPAAAPAPAPGPAAPTPSAPKSWASLAATGAKSWGSAVASQSRGTSEAPAPTSSSPAPSGPQSPAPQRPIIRQEQGHPAYIAAQNVQTPQCFVKSVTENVSDAALRQVLTSRFGPIKELEIVRNKACAFLEFQSLDAAKRAITASLPAAQGGEGGIRIETDGGAGQARIIVETRKERGERPPPRNPPINGDRGRGGFRGRGGPGGRGRGGPPPKA
ncbi:hypothetical protein BD310DRAFT_331140 [Dichomitus squalens]|uniref:NTF2 domain-containing protein n=1 Tax=Dichomitus squalens TaxID=114155 RepID=A0A4Q9Q0A8_9APHY|nr:hypothetical protein BD310DRAFT_331140 [Dichomitus squalens]